MLVVTTAPVHERLAFVFFVLEVCLLSGQIWTACRDGRSMIEPFLLALILLLATPRQYLSWRLGVITVWALPRWR